MSFKVLENSGTLITSTEGVSITRGLTNEAVGIVKGRLQDFKIAGSIGTGINELVVKPGHIIVQGINLVLETEQVFSVTPTSSTTYRYLICHIVAANEQIQADLELVQSYTYGSLNFKGPILTGEIRVPLAEVTIDSTGIKSIQTYIDYIDPGYVAESSYEEDIYNSTLTHKQGQLSFRAVEPAAEEPHRTYVSADYTGFQANSVQHYQEDDNDESYINVDDSVRLRFKKGTTEHILRLGSNGLTYDGVNLPSYLESLDTIVGEGLYQNMTATFGTGGNYKSVLNLSNLTENVDYQDNGTDSTQFNQGSKLKVKLDKGGRITINGDLTNSSYKVTINNQVIDNLTETYTTPTALFAQTVVIEALSSNNYYLSLVIEKYIDYTLTEKVNKLDQRHLYEHNIVLGDTTISNSDNIVTFRVLTDSAKALDEANVAKILHNRGNISIETCITASGRASYDSFSFYKNADGDTGYCDSVVIGVYVSSDYNLMVVIMSLDENEKNKVYSASAIGNNFHDTVIQIF